MVQWYGIVVLIILIFVIVLLFVDVYYANKIRKGETVSTGTGAGLVWANVIFAIILIILAAITLWYILSRGRKVKVCGPPAKGATMQAQVYTGNSVPVEYTEKKGIPLQVTGPNGESTVYYTDNSGVANATQIASESYYAA